MVPEVGGSIPLVHPRRLGRRMGSDRRDSRCSGICEQPRCHSAFECADTARRKSGPVGVDRLLGPVYSLGLAACRCWTAAAAFCSQWSSHLPLLRRENTPDEQPKLIENRGFECIERAHIGGHYVPPSPTFGSGGSNNVDSERSISCTGRVQKELSSQAFSQRRV